ncbi:type III secretion protein Q [Pseudomonas sp. JUb42]|uniref:type III secretion system cytoplasmic ring protein SctQ n=1 Tax=Pseudomonas sp. JUb42 TaxID=2940611 RepID=UPI002167553C|nr:type III secretion system cytoplasmic ring protein SctQ [Pseudomonas sp. JUb42]MCS3466952.1 type III secretion protein Q [Pseudomonas sp. JUb42]
MTSHEAIVWPQISLPRHERQWTALHNRLHQPRRDWHGQFAGQPLTVRWSGVAADTAAELWMTLGQAMFALSLPDEALRVLGLPASVKPHSLAGSLLLEQALLPLILPIEQLFGLPLRVQDNPTPRVRGPLAMHLGVQLGEAAEWPLQLHMDEDGADLLAAALDLYAPTVPHDLGHLPLPMTVDSGEAWLTLAELRSLLPGDVVMLDPWPASQVRLCAVTGLQARAQLDGQRLQLLEQPFAVNSMKEHHMTEVGAGRGLETSLEASLNELPLKLVCQVGSVEMTLAQLRELGTGSLLQLTPSMQEGVDLMINGRRVGQGQLVQVGEGLGVRLLSFATP